jgi:hypothetical protein
LINNLKTPYECFKLKKDLNSIIKNDTYSLDNSSVISFPDIREDVYSEVICAEKKSGIKVSLIYLKLRMKILATIFQLKWKRFFQLNSILRGHRPGEFSIK